jgi:hypothetical protein
MCADPDGAIHRIVALGASNLTRGLPAVLAGARAMGGPRVELLGALGHGRSYGADSRFVIRRLPGILQSGLWRQLSSMPPARTRALVTDVGNDIAYGFSAAQTLAWVADAVDRLRHITDDVVLTDVPLFNIRRLNHSKFLFFRSVLVPECRLSLDQLIDGLARVNEGLAGIASAHRLRFVTLRPEWYGYDPIHIRPSHWSTAWQEILGGHTLDRRTSWRERWRLYFMLPEREWLFGRELRRRQTGVSLAAGGKLWLY